MHYDDGTEANYLDLIIHRPPYSKVEVVGILLSASLAPNAPNGSMYPLAQRPSATSDLYGQGWVPMMPFLGSYSVTLKDCHRLIGPNIITVPMGDKDGT